MNDFRSRKNFPAPPRVARSKFFARSVVSFSVGLLLGTAAYAQKTEGSVFGQAKAQTTVVISNVDNGTTLTVTSDQAGLFSFNRLQPGRYIVESDGVKQAVEVAIGSGSRVSLVADLETVSVSASRIRPVIDPDSVESSTVFTAEQIDALPVSRSVNAVALLAPGVVKGDAGLGSGNIPSFGGASVAENGYYINGFDVTNIRTFLSYAEIPFDAIGQQQMKTGGYSAEFGRSLGGVISLSTKQGTNEWHGGMSIAYNPAGLRAKRPNILSREPEGAGTTYFSFGEANTVDSMTTNLYLGGPLLKDKLFVFGLVEKPSTTEHVYGVSQSSIYSYTTPRTIFKVDFIPSEQHRIEFTRIDNKSTVDIKDFTNAARYSTNHDGIARNSSQTFGGDVTIGKYTGYLTDNLTFSALVGQVNYQQPLSKGARTGGADCPVIYVLPGVTYAGCWSLPFPGKGGRDPNAPLTDYDQRDGYRLDLEYSLGKHLIRAGYDSQKFVSAEAGGSAYSGGEYYREFLSDGKTAIRGVVLPAGTRYQRLRTYNYTSGIYDVYNAAAYVEDNWKITPKLMLYGGIRFESFDNKNGEGKTFVKGENLLAPRTGFSFDAFGNGDFKVYANAGRYFIPVASNTNIRAARGEKSEEIYYTYSGRDPITAKPLNLVQIGTPIVNSDGSLADPATIADINLKPMSQDEFIIGFQKAIAKGVYAGVKYTNRQLSNGMDDWCDPESFGKWMVSQGYTNFDYHTMAGCQMINPGRDVTLMVDANNDGKLVKMTMPAAAIGMPEPQRRYDAVEFSLEKPFDGKWGGTASYTWSRSYGNLEGYVNSTIDQEDAGVTQDFDFATFTHGSTGLLPNNRTHAFKLYGNWALDENWRIGANLNITSGRPKSRIGYVPSDLPGAKYTSASTFYYLDKDGKTVLGERGNNGTTDTVTQLDLQLAYFTKVGGNKVTLQADVFNVFNSSTATETNEINDYSRATTEVGTVGRLSQNFGLPTAFQPVRSVRFTTRIEF
jgi:hypothetical protein